MPLTQEFCLDNDALLAAILECDVDAAAKEAAAPLVEAWIQEFIGDDLQVATTAVECGFAMWLDKDTLVIGMQDRIMRDELGYIGCEWKTAKEPKKNKDGSDSAWWNEEKWLQEIVNGPQLAIYALAMKKAMYFPKGETKPLRLNAENPRIMVRAAVKASPPRFWPSDKSRSMYQFSDGMLVSVEDALKVKAETIRAARRSGLVPWQLTGKQCYQYNRECQFHLACEGRAYPRREDGTPAQIFNAHDPAYEGALAKIPAEELLNPELVVLSASSYSDASDCMEKYRVLSGGMGPKDESIALDTGTVFHAGVGEYYRQIKVQQRDGGAIRQ